MDDAPPATPVPSSDAGGVASNRRAFFKKAGVGTAAAGALWIAPSILTSQGAAFASCVGNTTLNWAAAANLDRGPGAFTVGTGVQSLTVTVAANQNSVGTGSNGVATPFTTTNVEIGANNSSWYMQMAPDATSDAVTTTFTFSQSVSGLSFPAYDIDSYYLNYFFGVLRWQDRLTVTARNAASVAQNVNVTTSGTPTLSGSGTTSAYAQGSGNANIPNDSTDGNVVFSFPTPVKTVTISFSNPNLPGAGQSSRLPTDPTQYVGIGNLTWSSCF